MRLTALRQPPKDSPRPMHPRLKHRKSTAKDSPPPHLCHCKTLLAETKKRWRPVQYGTQKVGAVQAPHITDLLYSLPELKTPTTWNHESHLRLNYTPNENLPQTILLTNTRHPTGNLGAVRPGTEMRSQYARKPTAVIGPLASRRHAPPLPVLHIAKRQGHTEAGYQKKTKHRDTTGREGGAGKHTPSSATQ